MSESSLRKVIPDLELQPQQPWVLLFSEVWYQCPNKRSRCKESDYNRMEAEGTDIQTSAGGLSLIPLGIVGIHAFNGDRALLQSIARVTGKLHHSSHCPSVVTTGQVTILHEGLVAVACCKGCGEKVQRLFQWWKRMKFYQRAKENLHLSGELVRVSPIVVQHTAMNMDDKRLR